MIRYARVDNLHVSYEVLGTGPASLLVVTDGFVSIDLMDEEPRLARCFRRLASFRRTVRFDRRGVGLSDPVDLSRPPNLEDWVADAVAVLDAADIDRTAVFASTENAGIAMLLAALHPDRIDELVLFSCSARVTSAPDYPIGADDISHLIGHTSELEADEEQEDPILNFVAPSAAHDLHFRRWWLKAGRRGASPAVAQEYMRTMLLADLRPHLPSIKARTLVMRRAEDPIAVESHSRYVAEHIPDATYVEVPGADNLWWVGDADALLDVVEEFLTGRRASADPTRVISTILMTDLVGSTERAAQLGDRAWTELLEGHDATVRRVLATFDGRERRTTGDGFIATFDSPRAALRCAVGLNAELDRLGLSIRCGIHTGEIESVGDSIAGIGVHLAARVMDQAGAAEILVSRTVADLLTGSSFRFEDRGTHELKGVPGTWQLLALSFDSRCTGSRT